MKQATLGSLQTKCPVIRREESSKFPVKRLEYDKLEANAFREILRDGESNSANVNLYEIDKVVYSVVGKQVY